MKLQMIKAKYLIFKGDSANELSKNVNEFLDKIDIRQVIKMENIPGNRNQYWSCFITYFTSIEDIREVKIDTFINQ